MNIPVYVYIMFFVLVHMGFNRCFTRVIKLRRLLIAPLIFIILSIRGMTTLFDIHIYDLSLWGIGCIIGAFLGYMHVKDKMIKADHKQQLIQLPGDWVMLLLILIIFGFEFFIHYSIEAQWILASTFIFKLISLIVLGMIAGMSVGRAMIYFYKYRASTSGDLFLPN